METAYQATATAYMRFTKIKFERVVPAHIVEAINASYTDGVIVGRVPLIRLTVRFHENGEAGTVKLRSGNYTLGIYLGAEAHNRGFHQGPFMKLPPEAVAYLSHAAEEALAIVSPIVVLH